MSFQIWHHLQWYLKIDKDVPGITTSFALNNTLLYYAPVLILPDYARGFNPYDVINKQMLSFCHDKTRDYIPRSV